MSDGTNRKSAFLQIDQSGGRGQTGEPESRSATATEGRKVTWGAPGIILSVISLIAVMLTALGYGVSFAVESKFGIPHSTLFASTLDLIDLSSVAINSLISGGGEHLLNWRTLRRLVSSPPTFIFLLPFMLWLMAVVVWRYWLRQTPRLTLTWRKTWFSMPLRDDSWMQVLKSLVWVPAGAVLLGIGSWLVAILPLLLGVFLAIPPVIGLELGTAYIDTWVVGADVCTPLASAALRAEPSTPSDATPPENIRRRVNCVAVTKDGKLLVAGRTVTSTSFAIVVFDPATGQVRREGMDGVSIEVIELPVPKAPS